MGPTEFLLSLFAQLIIPGIWLLIASKSNKFQTRRKIVYAIAYSLVVLQVIANWEYLGVIAAAGGIVAILVLLVFYFKGKK